MGAYSVDSQQGKSKENSAFKLWNPEDILETIDNTHSSSMLPFAFSIFSLAEALKACAFTVIGLEMSP